MKLKQGIDYGKFFAAVTSCQGDVYFETIENDRLNLKSILSRFVFASAVSQQLGKVNGVIVCMVKEDYQHLQNFLEGEK